VARSAQGFWSLTRASACLRVQVTTTLPSVFGLPKDAKIEMLVQLQERMVQQVKERGGNAVVLLSYVSRGLPSPSGSTDCKDQPKLLMLKGVACRLRPRLAAAPLPE
jgi:hypothetical protein